MEVRREIKAATLRHHDRLNEQVHLAWRIEQIKLLTKRKQSGKNITETIVDLQKVLNPEPMMTPQPKAQTVDQMRATLAMLSARYGGPVRQRRG